ncbi:hypothetical protein BDQ12DRAFT_445479 [Crucibulum laeve]|uniref:Uncharacterized protein n=1 Tax=Crucibulum laeve TaxID=68775 RepID=A0A5C3LKH8_9AGAR|nr:hypothetical protein BDQ12DRAFT_445479 [Crucibulum laeve]
MSCSAFEFPESIAKSLPDVFNGSSGLPFNLTTDASVKSFISNVYCAADALTCFGICPNADLAGVGVRTAFWLSSTLGAILVTISPKDSTQGAWTSTVLTASIIIPAIKQKKQHLLSLYHATLVLNFATFSSLVSLAVAPMCTVWRQHEDELVLLPFDGREVANPEAEVAFFGEEGRADAAHRMLTNIPRRKVHRQRIVLSLALLTQISLQWAWAILLFTDPNYAQTVCSAPTNVLIFGKPFTAGEINEHYYIIWPLWLLFHLGITLVWGILLVHSSSPDVHPVLSRSPSISTRRTMSWSEYLPKDKGRLAVLATNTLAFLFAMLLLISSEVQVEENCVRGGENTDWSFGQVAALLLALAPAWSIFAALSKRPRKAHSDTLPAHSTTPSLTPDISIFRTDTATENGTPFTIHSALDSPCCAPSPSPQATLNSNRVEYLSVPERQHSRRRQPHEVDEEDITEVPR